MLFSDIEASTLLLNRLGRQWGEALSAQRAILRACFSRHAGQEMGTEGDSFFVVFASAHAALAAALEGQRQLRAHEWPSGVPVRVRMGLHTGEPERHEDGYIGMDVHRAARIAATAGGGQIVLSAATETMLTDLPADTAVRDLGWHRLKDLPAAEHLYDVGETDAGGEEIVFPPIRSLGTRASLPSPVTPLIGRQDEVRDLVSLFERDDARLVTLTGPGGTGKTRLALEVASFMDQGFPHGVFFVDLTAVDRAALMWVGVGDAVGAQGETQEQPRDRVLRFLADRQALLVLDNLEQIPDADGVIDEILVHAPSVSVLATSRRTMHLVSEYEHPVPPLDVPSDGGIPVEDALRSSAVVFFVRRARMSNHRFELDATNAADVIELCRKLDGLPLAIELAAARSRLLTPHAMIRRIDTSLGIGATAADRVPRQRSLGDTVGWSYDLLTEDDQRIFRRLGVFSGSCDLAAIETIAAFDVADPFEVVSRLVDSSLVRIVETLDSEPRLSMLETIRSFAQDRLNADPNASGVRLRHARWCKEIAVEIKDVLGGPRQMSALDRMESVEEDIRAALDWCLRPADEADEDRRECGFAILAAMTTYWYRFGYLLEGRGWYQRGIQVAGTRETSDVIDVLHGMGLMTLQQSDVGPAADAFNHALDIARRTGDRDRECRELNSLGVARREGGQLEEARRLVEDSLALAEETGSDLRQATALTNMVMILMDSGDFQGAVAAGERAVRADQARNDPWGIAINNANLTLALLRCEGPDRAHEHLAAVAADVIGLEDLELSIVVIELFAAIFSEEGDSTTAARLLGTADEQRRVAGLSRSQPDTDHLNHSLNQAMQVVPGDVWAAAYTSGRELTIPEAIGEALSDEPRLRFAGGSAPQGLGDGHRESSSSSAS